MAQLQSPLPTLVINLDADVERLSKMEKVVGRHPQLAFERVAGVDTDCFPAAAIEVLTRFAAAGRGTLGCFLAHASAWEKVSDADMAWALILEDDIDLQAVDALFATELPPDADIIFVNRRMSLDAGNDSAKLTVHPTKSILTLKSRLPPGKAAPGGDGYLLSAKGARKLLGAATSDRMKGHVDWRLLRYTLLPEDVASLGETWLSQRPVLHPGTSRPQWDVLKGYFTTPAVVVERRGRISTRKKQDLRSSASTSGVKRFELMNESISFRVEDSQDVIQREHAAGRFYESDELNLISSVFRPGMVFVDIGANVGNHTVYVGKYLKPREIIVIEPNPSAISILKSNIELNGLQEVVDQKHLGIALGASSNRGVSVVRAGNLGASRLSIRTDGDIKVEAGDSILARRKVDFIKIDVEGMELAVLAGLQKTLRRCKPTLFVEVADANRKRVEAWMNEVGYAAVSSYRRYRSNENLLMSPIN